MMCLRKEGWYTLKALGNPKGRGNKAAAPYHLTEALAQRSYRQKALVCFSKPMYAGVH